MVLKFRVWSLLLGEPGRWSRVSVWSSSHLMNIKISVVLLKKQATACPAFIPLLFWSPDPDLGEPDSPTVSA